MFSNQVVIKGQARLVFTYFTEKHDKIDCFVYVSIAY